MNYLAHLYLADETAHSLVGNLLGDFAPGDCSRRYHPEICRGILMHRQIDRFTDSHPLFVRSRNRIHRDFGLFRGVMVDIFYDHFLARNWELYSKTRLEDFCALVYEILLEQEPILPARLREILPRMVSQNWLLSYRKKESIASALRGIGRRFSRKNNLAEGFQEFQYHYHSLENDFQEFFPELIQHARQIRSRKG